VIMRIDNARAVRSTICRKGAPQRLSTGCSSAEMPQLLAQGAQK
jgi:hypothetical protein